MNKLVVISGCSGGGKSTLLAEFNHNDYVVVPEVGREIVKEQLKKKGDLTPWQNPQLFCEEVIKRSVVAYYQAKEETEVKEQVIFFDRCLLDGVSYYQTLAVDDARKYDPLIQDFKYDSTVYMAPPWPEIYSQDNERKHSFEEAVSEYERLVKFYTQYGYHLVELPKVSAKERYQWILQLLGSC